MTTSSTPSTPSYLPVRRRGRRPRPPGRAQPAHRRLHQPVDHPRPRPQPWGCCRPPHRLLPTESTRPAGARRARLHRQRQPDHAACQKCSTPRALLKLKQLCQEPANRNKTVCVAAQHRPRRAAASRWPPFRCAVGLPTAFGQHPRAASGWPQCHRDRGRRRPRRAHRGPAAGGLRPVAGQPAGPEVVGLRARRMRMAGGPVITRRTRVQLIIFAIITLLGVPSWARATPTSTGLLRRQLHGDGALGRLRRHLRGWRGHLPRRQRRHRAQAGADRAGVDVVLDIDNSDDEIPADAKAVVGNRSAVGEQYVDLQPQRDAGPYLDDGSEIDQQDTALPSPPTAARRTWPRPSTRSTSRLPQDHRRRARHGLRRHR